VGTGYLIPAYSNLSSAPPALAALEVCLPLFQTNFLPDLTHVNVLPDATEVIPALEQDAPALTAAFAGTRDRDKKREKIDKNAIFLFNMNRS
jgi:hypothetical protein